MQDSKSKYKTSICRHFTEKGYCSMKQKCHFAHGEKQLRTFDDPIPSNISVQLKPVSIYKTQLCKYYSKGYCKNSQECTYAHGTNDMQSMPVVPAGEHKQMMSPIPINCPPPVYPMYMVPVMVPMMPAPQINPATNNILTLIQNLTQVFPNNQCVYMILRDAHNYAMSGQTDKAKQLINQICNDPSRTAQQKQKLKKIMSNMMFLSSLNSVKSPFLNNTYEI